MQALTAHSIENGQRREHGTTATVYGKIATMGLAESGASVASFVSVGRSNGLERAYRRVSAAFSALTVSVAPIGRFSLRMGLFLAKSPMV